MKKLEKIGRIIYNYRVWSTLEWLKGEVEIYYNHHSERGGRWKTVPANMSGCLPEKEQVHWYICEENRNSRILWCLGAYKHDKSNQEGQERPKCGFPRPDQCIWINSPWSSLRIIQHLPHIRSNHNTAQDVFPRPTAVLYRSRLHHNMAALGSRHDGRLNSLTPDFHNGHGSHYEGLKMGGARRTNQGREPSSTYQSIHELYDISDHYCSMHQVATWKTAGEHQVGPNENQAKQLSNHHFKMGRCPTMSK